MGRIFKIVFNTILILLIILLSGYCILRFTNKVKIYNVETGSMEDKIHTGDYILLVKKSDYYVGDIVTYNVKGYFVTHRIVKIEDDVIITKGDANNTEDEGISKDQIEGKVVYCGGILNFIINYKFVIAAFLVGLYLLSCYFGDKNEEEIVFKDDDLSKNEVVENINKNKKTKVTKEITEVKETKKNKTKKSKK